MSDTLIVNLAGVFRSLLAAIVIIVLTIELHKTLRKGIDNKYKIEAQLIKAGMPFTRTPIKLDAFTEKSAQFEEKETPFDEGVQADLFMPSSNGSNSRSHIHAVK